MHPAKVTIYKEFHERLDIKTSVMSIQNTLLQLRISFTKSG